MKLLVGIQTHAILGSPKILRSYIDGSIKIHVILPFCNAIFLLKDADSEVKINGFDSAEAWGEPSSSLSFLITINVIGITIRKLKNKLHKI